MKMNLLRLFVLLTSLLGLFVACSKVKSPEQIAVYTKDEPIAVYARSPESTLIYNATLDLEVSNVDRAAKRAKEIAFEQGGYLINAQSWYRDGEKHTTVILALPVYQFERTRDDLLRLGTLTGEWISSELVSSGSGMQDIYGQITIYLHPRKSIVPEISLPELRPVRTFEKAFEVFVSIFGFMLDIVIWVTVVAGPFVLIGWGALKIYNWWRKPRAKISEETES
ncbi:DUF4349 domain-containing protein [Chloroflexota bacterium]